MHGNRAELANLPASRPHQQDHEFNVAFPATLVSLERAIVNFRMQMRGVLRACGFFAAELLLREALTNAVLHGSHGDPALVVCCAVRLNGLRLLIAVKDQGPGFDWRHARERQADVISCSGRGLEIYRKYATRVRFNNRGNAVVMQRFFTDRSS
jgi:anti-sigma regulatory factor (Ser/Thr protein kinase)